MFDVDSWKLENTPIEIQISGNHEGRVVAFLYVANLLMRLFSPIHLTCLLLLTFSYNHFNPKL